VEISVIIVNFNRRKLLKECLTSLDGQIAPQFELIVVDNGSSDGSPEMAAEEFGNSAKFRLQIIKNNDNRGYCSGNNQGIAIASGQFIALLNNDAVADPRWLTSLRQAFSKEEIGMAASKILVYEDPGTIDKVGHLIYPDGQNRGRGTGELDRGQYDRVEQILWPDGCAAMYRKTMLDEIGGFDEDLFAYGDDAELGLRARIAGWECLYMPEAVVRHHRASTLGLRSSRRLELIERNRILLAVKHFPLRLLWINPVFFGMRLGAGVWAALRGKGEVGQFPGLRGKLQVIAAIVKANVEALAMIPGTLRKRAAMRPIRRLTPKQIKALLLRYRIPLKTLMGQAI
jgi:GT2 family glycosyltransferase